MSAMPPQEVTQLLAAWSDGDRSALEKLLPLVADELHRLAHRYMNREREGHTLQTTALVNEAYLKLIDQRNVHWQNRAHFFGIASIELQCQRSARGFASARSFGRPAANRP